MTPGPRSIPVTLAVSGFAGSGKTEACRLLTRLTSWTVLDKDTLCGPLVEALLTQLTGDPHDRHTEAYVNRVRPLEYQCLWDAAGDNLAHGLSSILSAPFISEIGDPTWPRRMNERCAAAGGRFVLIWVASDAETMRRRVTSRDAGRDQWKIANWDRYLASIEARARPAGEHHVLDNGAGAPPLSDQVRALADQLLFRPS